MKINLKLFLYEESCLYEKSLTNRPRHIKPIYSSALFYVPFLRERESTCIYALRKEELNGVYVSHCVNKMKRLSSASPRVEWLQRAPQETRLGQAKMYDPSEKVDITRSQLRDVIVCKENVSDNLPCNILTEITRLHKRLGLKKTPRVF